MEIGLAIQYCRICLCLAFVSASFVVPLQRNETVDVNPPCVATKLYDNDESNESKLEACLSTTRFRRGPRCWWTLWSRRSAFILRNVCTGVWTQSQCYSFLFNLCRFFCANCARKLVELANYTSYRVFLSQVQITNEFQPMTCTHILT